MDISYLPSHVNPSSPKENATGFSFFANPSSDVLCMILTDSVGRIPLRRTHILCKVYKCAFGLLATESYLIERQFFSSPSFYNQPQTCISPLLCDSHSTDILLPGISLISPLTSLCSFSNPPFLYCFRVTFPNQARFFLRGNLFPHITNVSSIFLQGKCKKFFKKYFSSHL